MSFYSLVKKCVIGVHLAFIALMLLGPAFSKKKKHSPLIVKTVQFAPKVVHEKKSVPAASSAPVQGKKVSPAPAPAKKEDKPIKKEEKGKSAPAKKAAPAAPKKEFKAPPAPQVDHQLMQELQQKLSKIEKQKQELLSAREKKESVQTKPITLQIDSEHEEMGESGGYAELLVSYLYEKLQLPELGEVKIQLTLRQDGSIDKLVVLEAKSKKNKTYLEEKLPQLKLPPLESKDITVFTLNFCNL